MTSRDVDSPDISPDNRRNAHYIGGEWTAGNGDRLGVINPTTRSTIGEVPDGAESDADAAFEAATAVQSDLRYRQPQSRVQTLATVQRLLDEYEEELTTLFAVECGGPRNRADIESKLAQSQPLNYAPYGENHAHKELYGYIHQHELGVISWH